MSKFARLNEQQIAEIKRRALVEDQTKLAREFGTTRQLIWYHAKAKPRASKKPGKYEGILS
jgi:hypothetical protein